MRTLASIPALWLALTAAAPLQSSQMQAAAECRLPRAQFMTALKQFPVERTVDSGKGGERNITNFYTIPDGLSVHGFTVDFLAAADRLDGHGERMLLMANVKGDYASVERAVLAANNQTECDQRTEDDGQFSCGVYARKVDGWRVAVVLQQHGEDETGIACSFSRLQD